MQQCKYSPNRHTNHKTINFTVSIDKTTSINSLFLYMYSKVLNVHPISKIDRIHILEVLEYTNKLLTFKQVGVN